MVTLSPGDLRSDVLPHDARGEDLSAAMDTFYLTGRVTKDVGISLRESEAADPDVRLRAWHEAARRR